MSEEPQIELPSSNIAVVNGFLVKRTDKGGAVGAHPLASIRDLRVLTRFSPFGCAFLVGAAAGSVLAKLYIPWAVWSWIACIVLGLLALCGLFVVRESRLVVDLDEGRVRYTLLDDGEACHAFVITVRSVLQGKLSPAELSSALGGEPAAGPDRFRQEMIGHQRRTAEMLLTEGDPGPLPHTKISGAPWWPRGVPRPTCKRGHPMSFIAQVRLSDVPDLQGCDNALLSFHYCNQCALEGNMAFGWNDPAGNTGYDVTVFADINLKMPDNLGLTAPQVVRPRRVSLREVLEVPDPRDAGLRGRDVPDDYYQGRDDSDEHVYPGMVHVARSKLGGWPTWVQQPEWPTAGPGQEVRFLCQLDAALCQRAPWDGGGYAYLFGTLAAGRPVGGELAVQTT